MTAPKTKKGRQAASTLEQVKDKVGSTLATVRERSEDVVADTREKAYRAANETNRMFQEHPIAAVAAAAAAGAVIAIFLPKLAIGSAAGKAGRAAQQAVRNSGARQAAQTMFANLAKTEKAALQTAAVEAARLIGKRIKKPRSDKKSDA